MNVANPIEIASRWAANRKIEINYLLQILLVILLERQKSSISEKTWVFIDQIYLKLHHLQLAPQLNRQLLLESLLIMGTLC